MHQAMHHVDLSKMVTNVECRNFLRAERTAGMSPVALFRTPITLSSSQTIRADIFVVDRRQLRSGSDKQVQKSTKTCGASEAMGFLVGLRLCAAFAIVPPAIDEHHESCQQARASQMQELQVDADRLQDSYTAWGVSGSASLREGDEEVVYQVGRLGRLASLREPTSLGGSASLRESAPPRQQSCRHEDRFLDMTNMSTVSGFDEPARVGVAESETSFAISKSTVRVRYGTHEVAAQTEEVGRPKSSARPPTTSHRVSLATKRRFERRFKETPEDTIYRMLLEMVTQMNPRGKGCCFQHIGLVSLHRRITKLVATGCSTLQPKGSWQCPSCLALHSSEEECGICGYKLCTGRDLVIKLPSEESSACMGDDEKSNLSIGHTQDLSLTIHPCSPLTILSCSPSFMRMCGSDIVGQSFAAWLTDPQIYLNEFQLAANHLFFEESEVSVALTFSPFEGIEYSCKKCILTLDEDLDVPDEPDEIPPLKLVFTDLR